MPKRTAHSNQQMDYLKVENAKTIVSSVLDKGIVTATRLTRATPGHGYVDQHVTEDAFMIAFQLRDYEGDLWVDDRNVDFAGSRKGNFTLYDYNRIWQADMKSAFDCVNFYIPRASLEALADELGPRRVETLNVAPGASLDDPTITGLVDALLPALQNPEQASRLFIDHMGLALSAHLATKYGEAGEMTPIHAGGLAPWQRIRATAMIDAQLNGDLPLIVIANACGLSPSYFARAFKQSMGLPPHKWMLQRRVDKAKDLIRTSRLSLAEVAGACGFVDQSHFSRVFSRLVGTTPGDWRRTIRA